jgi:hypothetical protein
MYLLVRQRGSAATEAEVNGMKLITAIMRPEKLDELIDVAVDSRAHGLTEVRGFGQQSSVHQRNEGQGVMALPGAGQLSLKCRSGWRRTRPQGW